ncbi:MAG: hypothetical protein ACQESH_07095 [Campylobacterota bacterium]
MKKFNNELKEYEALEKQLMALYRSGVYITAKDVQDVGKQCGYELPLKERETSLRNLLAKAKEDKKLLEIFDGLIHVIDAKVTQYGEYESEYEAIKPLVARWKQRAAMTKTVIIAEKKKAALEARAHE